MTPSPPCGFLFGQPLPVHSQNPEGHSLLSTKRNGRGLVVTGLSVDRGHHQPLWIERLARDGNLGQAWTG